MAGSLASWPDRLQRSKTATAASHVVPAPEDANVNFPFLDVHPTRREVFRTNARLTETFDQTGLFSRDPRLPTQPWSRISAGSPSAPKLS